MGVSSHQKETKVFYCNKYLSTAELNSNLAFNIKTTMADRPFTDFRGSYYFNATFAA